MKPKFPTIKNVAALIAVIKDQISDEYRAHEDDDLPGILLTVGADGKARWSYQTGDTSYMGSAYHYPFWGQAAVYRRTNCREAAKQILSELEDNYHMSAQ